MNHRTDINSLFYHIKCDDINLNTSMANVSNVFEFAIYPVLGGVFTIHQTIPNIPRLVPERSSQN